ncbi:OadG family protein [Agathobaculum sp. M2]|uniref:OadG family protein n=2 Tax=Agathobaculum hominis TaxID=2763014 RepID=A0ABR7GP62_9FIRM|nr:OadG family protein [Agathobaculum hominis]
MIAVSGFFIVFLMLAVLWGIIVIVSRAVGAIAGKGSEAASAPAAAPAPAPVPAAPAVVVLEGIDETQTACVMAIVSHETGIPLDELVFKSIKAV